MRAPSFTPTIAPVQAYQARFSAPGGPNLANTIGRVLVAGGAELGHLADLRSAVQAAGEDTAGRARALQDRVALGNLLDTHGSLQGGAAVAAQPQALAELDRIKAEGQATLGSPGMIAAYDRQMAPVLEDAANRITDHAVQQMGVERQAVADQTMQVAQKGAAADWQNPSRFVQGLTAVQALALSQAAPDTSDADRAEAARVAVGGAVARAVDQSLAAGEPEFAAHIMGGWGNTLPPADYQRAVARLGQAEQNQRISEIFATSAGGTTAQNSATPEPTAPSPGIVAMAAPVGAAIHTIAGGQVSALEGAPDNRSVKIQHPDGSSSTYGGLGLAAVSPGDLVTPMHVIGSASPVVTLAASTPTGDIADADALLRQAGGAAALIGTVTAPREWDQPTVLDRIARRQDISPDEQALATSFAQRQMAADQAQQAAGDLAAGRSVVSLVAAAPDRVAQVADLPPELAAQMTPSTLALVDTALRGSARNADPPVRDSADALRLALLRRQDPGEFAQINLAPLIGTVHAADLTQLAADQAAIAKGQVPDTPRDPGSSVLDAMARYEFASGASLPDQALPTIKSQAETRLRLNQTDMADRPSIDSAVSDAIQSQVNPA